MAVKAKRTAKDSVFCDLFDEPEYQLKLYKLLHPEDEKAAVSDFTTVTLSDILTDQPYNDLGFIIHDKLLFLVEAQSTWSINIIPRILMYLAQTLKDRIVEKKENVYSSKKIDFPKPEFYVVYTGNKNVNDAYSLAGEFFDGDSSFIDIKVKALRGSKGRKDIITQYVTFTKILDDQIKKLGRTEKAIKETIRICKDEDILREYLSKREEEVISIMTTLFSQEDATKAYVYQEKEESRKEGQDAQAKKTALNLSKAGMSPQQIAKAIDYSVEKVEEWLGLQTA